MKLLLALGLAIAPTVSTGCTHGQLTNRQVAYGAVIGGAFVVLVGGMYLYCETSCDPQFSAGAR